MNDECTNPNCKMVRKLKLIHRWGHAVLKALKPEELHRAHDLGQKILDLLNEEPAVNGIKFVAAFEALAVGADMMEECGALLEEMDEEDATHTVN